MMGGIVNQDIHVDRSIRLAMPQMVDETDVSLTCELLTLLEDVKQPGIVSAFLGRLATGFQFDCAALYRCQPQNWPNATLERVLGCSKTFDIGSPLHPAVSKGLQHHSQSPLFLHPRAGVRYSFDALCPELAGKQWSGLAVALCVDEQFYGALLFAGADVGLTSRLKENLLVRLCNSLCRALYATEFAPTVPSPPHEPLLLETTPRHPSTISVDALNSMERAVVLTDPLRNIVAMNAAAASLTQWSETEAIGKPLEFIVHLVNDRFNQRQRPCPGPVVQRSLLVQKTGSSIPVDSEIVPIIDPNGHHSGFIASFKCERENRLVERALIRTKEEQRLLIERLPMGIVIVQGDVIAYANPAWRDMLSDNAKVSFVGTQITSLLHPEEREIIRDRLRSDERTVGPLPPGMIRLRRTNKSYANVDVFKAQVVEYNGVLSVLLTVMDRTEAHMMRAQLAVSDHLASVGTLAAGLAHEINNPMTYLLDNLDQVHHWFGREDIDLPPLLRQKVNRTLGEARDGAVRVRDIVRELKYLEREPETTLMPTSIFDAIQSAIHLVRHQTARNITFNHRCDVVPKSLASPRKLTQVFMNLLMATDGLLDEATHPIHIELFVDDAYVVTNVSTSVTSNDSVSTLPTMAAGTSRSLSLGLMVSQHIIQGLGGSLQWFNGQPEGRGVQVRLPKTHDLDEPLEKNITAPLNETATLRILVVDDEPLVARALKRSLKTHHVEIVSKGADALKRFRTQL